jgi:hypothetical protein
MFAENPPLAPRPYFSRIPVTVSNDKHLAVKKEVENLLEKKAAIELFPPYTPGFYSSIFVIPKKNSEKLRLVINLKPLNKMLVKYPFKMETTRSITAALQQGDWTISVDLTDAYFHVPIHKDSQKYLRFTHDRRVFQFVALPFGLAPAPYVFTKLMATVGQTAHKRMLHLYLYLDDSLMRNTVRQELVRQVPVLLEIFNYLGFLRNEAKSDLVPSQRFTFLGILYDLLLALAMIPEDRWLKLKTTISTILKDRHNPARNWCVALGILTSVQDLVCLGKLHLRRLQIHLNHHWEPRNDMSVQIPMSEECVAQFQWWLEESNVMRGMSILPFNPSINLFTDASTTGWGAHVGETLLSGLWTKEERTLHINNLEMLAVIRTVDLSEDILRDHQVLLSTDNTTVVSYINHQGGTHSPSLCELAEQLLLKLHSINTEMKAAHIPGCRNVLADSLSRSGKIISTEWTLHQEIFRQICSFWGIPQIDLFATRFNNRLPTFISPYPDERAAGVDALSLDWNGLCAYAYPPTVLIPKVLQKISESSARILLIAPAWTSRSWFPMILELLEDLPWQLPLWEKLLKQPRSMLFSNNTQMLDLHAWPLCGKSSSREAFRSQWRQEFRKEIDVLHQESTSRVGERSNYGANTGKWTLSRPLFPL